MGVSSGQILPRATDAIMACKQSGPIRGRVAAGLDGEVAEIGFGSGLNVASYPRPSIGQDAGPCRIR
jgi:hypothetical protein